LSLTSWIVPPAGLSPQLWRHGLAPGFELMGNPGGLWRDFSSPEEVAGPHPSPGQVEGWHRLVGDLARRYVARWGRTAGTGGLNRYGLDWVAGWRWETWNEPDHGDFCGVNFRCLPALGGSYGPQPRLLP
jgi:hypothetical protein